MKEDLKLNAQFVVGSNGKPEFIEGDTRKHYKIRLSVEGVPTQSESVIYELDDSYYSPVREVFKEAGGDSFEEEITSYGDFTVSTNVSGLTKTFHTKLSDALETSLDHYGPSTDIAAIADALEDIKKH